MVCADYSDPKLHSHSAAHIMISLGDEIEIFTKKEKKRCKGIVIPSGLIHTADTGKNKVLVFLFDNTTSVANQIKQLMVLADELIDGVVKAYYCFEKSEKTYSDYREFIKSIFKCTGLNITNNIIVDERILSALTYIQSNINEQMTCKEVAKGVFLSEGRFSHLFREQVGMTFSAYVVYQRVMKTYTEIINGKSITEAALEAGFSSSAHFAETNNRLFGLAASTIKRNLIFLKIAEK